MAGTVTTRSTIGAKALQDFAEHLLRAGGFAADHAEQTAELLIWANLRGVDSHGVLRIPRYVEMVELGLINPQAAPRQKSAGGATAVIDADRAPGSVAMNLAAGAAVRLAGQLGIGWCAARGITHAGAIGYYAMKVAERGHVAIVMTASKPLMIYHGARAEGVSTNPLAIAAPSAGPGRPLLFDMSTAAVAAGKITAARDAGQAISPGWAVDESGRETTDPAKVKAVLPMAGAKGSGLSLMIEVLASLLVGNPLIAPALTEGRDLGGNGLVIALSPAAFGAAEDFAGGVAALAAAIKGLPPAADADAVFLPGERGFREMEKRSKGGIPLAAGTRLRLLNLAEKLGVPTPKVLA